MPQMRRPPLQSVIVVIAVLGVLVLAGAALWRKPLMQLVRRGGEVSTYEPRELVPGSNEPPAPRVAPELEQLERAALDAAAAYAREHRSRALIVSRHDHIVFERYWQGTSFDTLADAQSFTSLLAALAAGVAISHRMIAWPDEPVSAFLSEWRNDSRGAITVRDLMQMTSGLAPPRDEGYPRDLSAAALAAPLATAPGTTRVEQWSDPQLLALVIERATRQRYASFLSQVLWRRVGAGDAWLWLDRKGGEAHADCCMVARQGDWIRIGELLLREGNYRGDELMRPGWITLMRTPAKADPDYGAYLRVGARPHGEESFAARDVFVVAGKGGNRLWLVPSLGIAILCTGPAAGRDAAWSDSQIPNLIIRGARDFVPPAAHPGGDVSALVPNH